MSNSPIQIQNKYNVSRMKTLIDLSGNYENYKLAFRLQSNSPFYALVLSQSTLDTTEDADLDFVYVENELEGEVISDHKVTEPYYLILKSSKPCDVNVTFHFTELPPSPERRPSIREDDMPTAYAPVRESHKSSYSMYVFYILLVLFIIAVVYMWRAGNSRPPATLLNYYNQCVDDCKPRK